MDSTKLQGDNPHSGWRAQLIRLDAAGVGLEREQGWLQTQTPQIQLPIMVHIQTANLIIDSYMSHYALPRRVEIHYIGSRVMELPWQKGTTQWAASQANHIIGL